MEMLKRILIVDDEPTILLSLPYCLDGDGVEVATSCRLDEAKDAVARGFFDVVITDIRMSGVYGMEGLELLDFIRDKSPGTKVIAMSAYGLDGVREEALDRGAVRFFDKPLDIGELINTVKEIGVPVSGASSRAFLNNLKRYHML